MIWDVPPKIWMPPKPAIIRPAEKKLLAPALAASFLPGMFPGGAISGGEPPVITLTDGVDAPSAFTTTHTFSSQNIGSAAADRYVIVAAAVESGAGTPTITSVTIGGVSATFLVNAANANFTRGVLASLLVTTGTTTTIVINTSTNSVAYMAVWSKVGGTTPDTPFDTGSDNTITGGSASLTIDYPANGAVLGLAAGHYMTGGAGSLTGLTSTGSAIGIVGSMRVGHDNGVSAETNHAIAKSSYYGSDGVLLAASWG